ncbi:FAD/NAD(P)-binding domain-containing protein [Canariomyces notabilis]|uniref:FAD/NAD(P)-binding domain-containing protein n=1 Tax=Canariomyces notabilis TaxID=2074819 RepID=A0AAN6TDY5_9PEZI|nr:FAD/NAD(P)-binding domain-containing protein [Canariomyces arenarius]
MPSAVDTQDNGLHVAIIGAGITGINLALGLQARNVSFAVYERAPEFREIGAGIGFSPNAERAMGLLSPAVLSAFKRVANPNGEDYFQWIDGYGTDELLFKLHVGKDGFQGCRRSDVLEEWAKLLSDGAVQFGKELDTISSESSADGNRQPLRLHFKDGTTALADAVIGCDGIRSRVRELILTNPETQSVPTSAHPHYTQKFCYRALVPMSRAVAAVGPYRAGTRFMYNGPGAHVITYPVGGNTVLNVLAVLSDPSPVWRPLLPGSDTEDNNNNNNNNNNNVISVNKHTAPGSKAEVEAAFAAWQPTVRSIVALLPEEGMDKWAIFDMAEHPAPGYVRGRVCVAGDAAHATGPHLGAGGGMGIEDALVLAELLAEVDRRVRVRAPGLENEERELERGKERLVETALALYNAVRYERTQGVVRSTRAACDLFHWKDPAVGRDPERFGREITGMFHAVWDYDVEGMVVGALAQWDARAEKL